MKTKTKKQTKRKRNTSSFPKTPSLKGKKLFIQWPFSSSPTPQKHLQPPFPAFACKGLASIHHPRPCMSCFNKCSNWPLSLWRWCPMRQSDKQTFYPDQVVMSSATFVPKYYFPKMGGEVQSLVSINHQT